MKIFFIHFCCWVFCCAWVDVRAQSSGRWEARLSLADFSETRVLRIGEDAGRMATVNAAFPAVTVVVAAQGVSVVPPDEFPVAGAVGFALPHSAQSLDMRLIFWGSPSNAGRVVAEVESGGAWVEVSALSFTQEQGWAPPSCFEEERWAGALPDETGGFLEIVFVRTGSLLMVR